MKYIKACDILPKYLLEEIQKYVEIVIRNSKYMQPNKINIIFC